VHLAYIVYAHVAYIVYVYVGDTCIIQYNTRITYTLYKGVQAMDHNGIPRGRLGVRSDEARSIRRTVHCDNPQRDSQGHRLSSFTRETTPRHKR